MKAGWTDEAQQSLEAILSRIEHFAGSSAAERLRLRVDRHVARIEKFPSSGRIVPEYGLREVREVIEAPYRLMYWVRTDRIEILSFVHGAQDLGE